MRPGGVSSTVFINEFCMPLSALQRWEKAIITQFGATATDFSQFQRVMKISATLANPPSRLSIPARPLTQPAH